MASFRSRVTESVIKFILSSGNNDDELTEFETGVVRKEDEHLGPSLWKADSAICGFAGY